MLLQVGSLRDPMAHRPDTGAMGLSKVQILSRAIGGERSNGLPVWRGESHGCLCTGGCYRDTAEQWEPDEVRASRRDLRAPGDESPPGTHRNIHFRSENAGHRVMASLARSIEGASSCRSKPRRLPSPSCGSVRSLA
jgi:hypothetical protein